MEFLKMLTVAYTDKKKKKLTMSRSEDGNHISLPTKLALVG